MPPVKHTDSIDSSIVLAATPYTVIRFGSGDGRVVTRERVMSIDEAAQLVLEKLEAVRWSGAVPREVLEDVLDALTLVAEVNLYQARLLWTLKVPGSAGMPAMLSPAHEADELQYLRNLAEQRTLPEGELALHLLERGAFMEEWAEKRRLMID